MKKILICDDEKDVVESLSQVLEITLEDEEIQITEMTDSIDALISITENKFDLVITDYKMPKMTGTEFLTNMYSIQSSRNKETPVIIISGFLPDIDESQFNDKNITLIEKPYDMNQLVKVVKIKLNLV